MNLSKCVLPALFGLLLSCAALADEPETRPYISAGYAHVFADGDRDSDDGNGVNLGAGFAYGPYWGFELGGFASRFGRDGAGDPNRWREIGGKLDTMFFYSRAPAFRPYVGIGVGAARSTLRDGGGHSTDPLIDFGVGFFHTLRGLGGDRLSLRGDLRYRWLDTHDFADDPGWLREPVASVGLAFALGERPQPVKEPGDADHDGVMDDKDLCPGTEEGMKVDERGCPIDADGDGVPDGLDECPGTAPGIAVDEQGCPTSLGSGRFKVSGSGAELRFEDVHFEFDQATLSRYGREMLDDAANVINATAGRYPGLKIDIDGHTDNVGTPGYNLALSEKRALAVKQYLIKRGVDPDRINIYSYGESKPMASNDTADGRTQNRRVETRTRPE